MGRGTLRGVAAKSGSEREIPRESAAQPRSEERTCASWLLLLGVICFAVFAGFAVPRLTNNLFGDLELTGWSSPFAERIARGERPYVDFVVPIPPGSFLILALVQKLSGRVLLLQELWLVALCQAAMALTAYAIVRPFTSRHTSLLVAFASLVVLLQSPKACAYDPTAELVAWLGIALGAHALVRADDEKRRWLFAGAGFAASSTLLFEARTATGVLGGWLVAFAYLALAKRWTKGNESLKSPGIAFCGGILAGFSLLAVTLFALGSNPIAFVRAVAVDSIPLQGGAKALLANLLDDAVKSAAFPSSLVFCAIVAFVVLRMRGNQGLVPSADQSTLDRRASIVIAGIVSVTFGSAIAFLALHVTRIPDAPLYYLERLSHLPSMGVFAACLFFVIHLSRRADPAGANGHRQNALLVVAACTSLLHDPSTESFEPLADANPLIPFAFLYLFLALERAGLPRLRLAVFALSMLSLYSTKLDRAFRAQARVGSTTNWAGLRINKQGIDVLGAALRVQELAGETGTVLVLPEDLELVALVDRPRPALVGGAVFGALYPARLAERDIATLLEHPPKVLVIRPRQRDDWRTVFAHWKGDAGARQVLEVVLERLLRRYHLDRSVLTRHGDRAIALEIWVRND